MTATHRRVLALVAFSACLLCLLPQAASAAGGPAWKAALTPLPANFAPGREAQYLLQATNVGSVPTEGTVTLQVSVPAGLEPLGAEGVIVDPDAIGAPMACALEGQTATCESSEALNPGRYFGVHVAVRVPGATPPGTLEASALAAGGGALPAPAIAQAEVSAEALPFGFLGSISAPLTGPDGAPADTAASHPYQYTVDLGFPAAEFSGSAGNLISNSDPPRDVVVDLPRGLVGDPAATPVRCTEAELTSADGPGPVAGCPPASAVGVLDLTTAVTGAAGTGPASAVVYNMVPPPGAPAELAFDAAGVGIFVHLIAGVRSAGDYGLYTKTNDVLALAFHPFLRAQAQVWGDPSAAAHDQIRGACLNTGGSCPVPDRKIAFLTMPGDCPGEPLTSAARADGWSQPGVFDETSYESADLQDAPVSISGCNSLAYEPTISSQATTDLADSPSGLHFTLHQPTDLEKEHTAPAELRDATVVLPEGMSVNPSQADGLDACTEAEIGYLAEAAGIHFSEDPQSCPDAAKLGTVEVTTPVLAQYGNEGTDLIEDPETGEPIAEPLHGSVYLAKPYQNPFGSLLAIYLALEDGKTGIVAKLAGRVEADPQTGRLTTVFTGNPELPIEDISLHLFGGARGSLITPPACGTHVTTSTLTPWSAPEGADAHPVDSFQTTGEPGGGACPGSEAGAPNSPDFSAGTLAPVAGAYSPFVLKLSRSDGSQRLRGLDTTLPPGLSGKLAGIAECTGAQLAQAASREAPQMGQAEKDDPSCPSSSEVGTVHVAAGAGPTPFWTSGHAYLAGPYKGAPLSLAVIVPAVAGPFDLGAVVTRVALNLDPVTAQIHAVSDPFPTILEGIPLDLRTVSLEMGRPKFTLNPTSCDEMQIAGQATSALGSIAPLTQRFQVGGCSALPFKPKLSLALKGSVKRSSNPRLIATLTAREGEANVAAAQVKLPHPVFLDQSHIKTICTRVQFAADQCPAGSVYGKVEARTPLLDYPLTGSVYLRSSSHPLPDLVAKLRGPASQPIEIDLDGKTDAVHAALRNTFEAVPDAPVSFFRLELFGGKRGLVEMSSGFCTHRKAVVNLTGQNGKVYDTTPVVRAKCPQRKGHKHHRRHQH